MALSGYELRLELLKMAKDLLEQEYHSTRSLMLLKYERDENKQVELPLLPLMPTPAEIIVKASELNQFINQKS